jgi:hypothetical protein
VAIWVLGNEETQLIGTTTGEDHVDGTVTWLGTNTNDDVGTVTINELAT